MNSFDLKFFRALSVLFGSVVGVGIFGLPYAFAKSGILVATIELILITILICMMQWMYTEIVVQMKGRHRLPGYVAKLFGKKGKWITTFCITGAIWSALLAYLLIGSKFYQSLLTPIFGSNEMVYVFLMIGVSGLFLYKGAQLISKVELFIVCGILFLFFVLMIKSWFHFDLSNIVLVEPKNIFFPYGILLFALAGIGVVPEVRDVLGSKRYQDILHVVLIGFPLIAFLYFVFSISIVGMTGSKTSAFAFDSMMNSFGVFFQVFIPLLGSLLVTSAFVILGMSLENMFRLDFHRSSKQSFLLVMIVPVVLYFFGARSFIEHISFVGSVFGGLLGCIVAISYLRLKLLNVCVRPPCFHIPHYVSISVFLLFAIGVILKISERIYSFIL